MATYRIPEENLANLLAKLVELKAKAIKLNQSLFYSVGGFEDEVLEDGTAMRWYTVTVEGEAPKLAGWTFAATLDFNNGANLVLAVPFFPVPVPVAYRTAEPKCDQCGKARNRKVTYVIYSETEGWKQIGSNCLCDFLGHNDPQALASWAEMLISLDKECREEGEYRSRGGGSALYISTRGYVACVVACIENHGWVSSKNANEWGKPATSGLALSALFPRTLADKENQPSEPHFIEADKVITWVRTELAAKSSLNDYEYNLTVALSGDALPRKGVGIAASAVMAYRRAMGQLAERAKMATSEYVGDVGKRMELALDCTIVIPTEGMYGMTYITKLLDATGNVFVWFASGVALEAGKKYAGKGTVKDHDEYNGIKQTVLSRCKFAEVTA